MNGLYSNVLIVSHFEKRTESGGGPPQDIRDYFLPKVRKIFYIEHPFPYSDQHTSSMSIYENGIKIKQLFTFPIRGPQFLYYIFDFLFTLYFVIIANTQFDFCVALDNLNTVSVLPFKKLGKIKKLIFYSIDYVPVRFTSSILNRIYHSIDKIACYHADTIWVLSERMVEAREKNHIDPRISAPSVVLPMGANLKRVKIRPLKKINRYDIVYVGTLIKKQGVRILVEALPYIVSKIPAIRCIIIGSGEEELELKNLAKQCNVSNHIVFKGFMKEQQDVERILCTSAIGLAPYVPDPDNFTVYTDPGKIKMYLGCGLPIVITDVPAIAKVIESNHAGIIAKYEAKNIAKAIITLLSNDTRYKRYRDHAILLSKQYDTSTLIETALRNTG